ncbi:RHS repeat-associated core domain-containing protein [Aquincola sp. MAHUQ-54]|uniref:RHS repeat-associated core domain-containing protein n=1 Tax=Aquincola agrisoli TaxID=3119538 RepID=A0AAW9Q1B6_9BURK
MARLNFLRAVRAAGVVVAAAAAVLAGPGAHAQAVGDPYNYSRSSSFGYAADGLLESETVEPGNPQLCVTTSYAYDSYGNKTSSTTAGCAGASGLALFDSRSSSVGYATHTVSVNGSSVSVPAGQFATSSSNALSQSESRTYDPRFGAVLALTGPNGLVTSWQYDDFGRKVQETRADGTKTVSYYCTLGVSFNGVAITTATNSPGCHNGGAPAIPAPASGEAPADALRYEHTVSLGSNGVQMGPFTRVYFDRAGRKLRTVTQAFDGADQLGGTTQLVVQDIDYNAYGTAVLQTQPYFLATGSSIAGGGGAYGMTLTEVDALGRPTAAYTTDGQGSVASKAFGSRGSRRAAVLSTAYAGLVTTTTDDKGRPRTEEKNAEGKVVRVTDALGAQLVHVHDAFGNLVATKDALQNVTTIAYDVRGRKLTLSDPDAGVTGYCYDALGQLKAQQTSNQRGSHAAGACPGVSGAGSTAPTVAGWTTIAYDKLGRTTHRIEPEYATSWTYDKYADGSTCNKGVGKLCQVTTTHGLNRSYVYDTLGRPTDTRLTVSGGPAFASTVSYDATTGKPASQTYPTGVKLNYVYTGKGFLQSVTLGTAVTVQPRPATPGGAAAAARTLNAGSELWRAMSVDAWGGVQKQSYHNGIQGWREAEADTGRVTRLAAGVNGGAGVIDQRTAWNSVGQLTSRIDALGDGASGVQVLDTFQYDAIGRLTSYQVSGNSTPVTRTVNLQYNALGMLLYKSDVGLYTYGAQATAGVRPHALQRVVGANNVDYGYDLNGNLQSASGGKYRSVSYTSFNLPDGQSGIGGPGGSPRYTWLYDENHQRLKEVRSNAQGTRTTWNLHPHNQGGLGFEREEAPAGAQNRHYLTAGGGVIGVLVTTGALPTLAGTAPPVADTVTAVKLEYWHKDQLGSLVATTDHWGTVTARYAYDPFGKRRYTTSAYDANGNLVIDWTTDTNAGTDRGFTGHEHLDDVGLIHMNGRVFDPTLGRFMQADPFVQDPLALQNYDRYAYCYNNPLTCTDPSGYFSLSKLWKKLRPFVGIAISFWLAPGAPIWGAEWGFLGATGITSPLAQAAVAGFVGGAVGSGSLQGGLQGAFSAAMFFQAGDLISGAGVFSSLGGIADPIGQVMVHGVAGCVTSVAGGGKCGPGAISAAFSKAATFAPGMKEISSAVRERGDFMDIAKGTIVSSVVGGTGSVLGGGKFSNGAQTGAFSYLFNWLAHVGVKMKVPLVGGASFGIGVSNNAGSWDAGVIIESDLPVVHAGKLLGKTAVEIGLQEGDFLSNKGEQSLNMEAGYKAAGVSVQRSADGRITGGAVSFGPQMGLEVSGQQTRTLSIRNEVIPAIKGAIDKVKNWFGS